MTESNASGSPPPESGPKPEDLNVLKIMSIKIKDQQQQETYFKVKPTTKLEKAFTRYCEDRSADRRTFRFLFHGSRVQKEDTPASLDMTDGDEIQAMTEQLGGNGTPAPEPSPELPKPDGPKQINIKVVDQSQNEVFFKIKEGTLLKKVMDAYCERQGIARNTVRFLLEGERIQDHDTPLSKEMEGGDTIEVVREQLGGNGGEGEAQANGEGTKMHINIHVKDDHGNEKTFKVKLTTPMVKLMDAFCGQLDRAAGSLRFFTPDGKRVQKDDTPTTLGLEDGDLLDAHEEQLGGDGGGSEAAKDQIVLKVVRQDNYDVTMKFKVKLSTKMGKLMTAFIAHQFRQIESLKFFTPNGRLIRGSDNPKSLGLENGAHLIANIVPGCSKSIITFYVKDLHNNKTWFKMKSTTKMEKLMRFYCKRVGQSRLDFWTATGERIRGSDTPLTLGLKKNEFVKCCPYWGLENLANDFLSALAIDADFNEMSVD